MGRINETSIKRRADLYADITNEIITGETDVMGLFGFTPQQMRVFNTAFAGYLLAKESAENAYLAKHPAAEVLCRFPVIGIIAQAIINDDRLNDLAREELKEELNLQIFVSFLDQSPAPRLIVLAADYLSTAYLDSKKQNRSFPDVLEEKTEFINRKVFRR